MNVCCPVMDALDKSDWTTEVPGGCVKEKEAGKVSRDIWSWEDWYNIPIRMGYPIELSATVGIFLTGAAQFCR